MIGTPSAKRENRERKDLITVKGEKGDSIELLVVSSGTARDYNSLGASLALGVVTRILVSVCEIGMSRRAR